ncbi:MAG: OmpA family protein, partial [Cytophagaceae bacterium]
MKLSFLFILLSFSSFAQNLIKNGSFEEGAKHWNNWKPPGLPIGYIFEVSSSPSTYGIVAPADGTHFAEVDYESNFSQTLETHPGETYKLKFAITRRYNAFGDRWFRVLINGREVFEKLVNTQTFGNTFEYQSIEYTAELEKTTISFYSYGTSGSGATYGVMLDDVSFTKVPSYLIEKNKMSLITGNIINEVSGMPVKTIVNYTINSFSGGYTWSDSSNGAFQLAIINPVRIRIQINATGYLPFFKEYNAKEVLDKVLEIKLTPIQTGCKIVLNNVLFEQSKYDLNDASREEITKLISFLKENPKIKIKLIGHTDNMGNYTSNIQLSLDRVKE